MSRTPVPIEDRFAEKHELDPASGCWNWTASLRANGYAQFRYSKAKNGYGHVYAYEAFVGPIPAGMHVHHVCENKACVNPEHLSLVTPREHITTLDDTPARRNKRKTHCPRGHEYEGENLYVNPKTGRRTCRACQRLAHSAPEAKAYHRNYMREYQRRMRADARKWREGQPPSA